MRPHLLRCGQRVGGGVGKGNLHLYIPNGARGVDAGRAQALGVCLVPVEGCERRTELAVLVLHLSQAASKKTFTSKNLLLFLLSINSRW